MRVVPRDVIWLLSQIRVISSELAKRARATATPAVHVGALPLGSTEPFSSLWSRALMRRRSVRNRQNLPVFMANPTSSAMEIGNLQVLPRVVSQTAADDDASACEFAEFSSKWRKLFCSFVTDPRTVRLCSNREGAPQDGQAPQPPSRWNPLLAGDNLFGWRRDHPCPH
jgi:hypothetical protein